MSISCWKAIGSPEVAPYPTLLTTFDGHSHRPHGILPAFLVCVGGKVVNVEVDIVDSNLDYNILLGQNWVHVMDVIVSSLFRILRFPHEGGIVTIYQMAYSPNDPNASSNSTVPLVKITKQTVENLGVRMYSSLIGTFYIPSPIAYVNAISSSKFASRKGSFITHYFSDPWLLPPSFATFEEGKVGGMAYPISGAEITYQSIENFANFDPIPLPLEDLYGDMAPVWNIDSTSTMDCLDIVLPSEGEILEAMTRVKRPCDDLHHQSYFLPDLHQVESIFYSPPSTGCVHKILNTLAPAQIFF